MAVRENKTLLTAEDKASAVFKQFQRSLSESTNEMDKLRNAAVGLGTVLTLGLGVTAVANATTALAKFRAELERVSVVTGTTVENLSVIGQAAKLTNTDMGTVQAALVKLTKGLSASNAETKDTARALEYLGVKGRDAAGQLRDPGVVMQEVAKMMGGLADGSNKTAIALALFGKSGAEMLPTLKAMYENGDLVAKVTTEQALQAKQYEQALVRMGIAQGAVAKTIYSELIPPATELIKVFTQAMTGADGANAAVKELAQSGDIRTWGERAAYTAAFVVDAFKGVVTVVFAVGSAVGASAAEIGAYFEGVANGFGKLKSLDFAGAMGAGKDAREQITAIHNDAIEQIGKIYAGHKSIRFELEARFKLEKEIASQEKDNWDMQGANGGRAGFHGTDHVTPDKADPLQSLKDLNAELTLQIDLGRVLLQGEKELEKVRAGAYEKYGQAVVSAAEALAKTAITLEKTIVNRKRDNETLQEYYKLLDEGEAAEQAKVEIARKLIEGMDDSNKKLEYENSLIGLSAKQIALSNVERERQVALMGKSAIAIDEINKKYDQKAALISYGESLQAQVQLWDSLSTSAGNFFADLFTKGRSAFDRLKQSLESFAAQMLAFFAKQYILQIVAGGSATFGATAASAATGALGNMASSGLGTIVGGLGTIANTVTGGFTGGIQAGLIGSPYAGAGVLSGAGSAIGEGLAAIGPVGWIALAAMAAYAIFSQKRGGDKTGGSFQGSYDATGSLVSTNPTHLFGLKPEESAGNASVQSLAAATAKSYFELAKQFGGTAAALSFGLGYDSDPKGTAPSRISSYVRDASGNNLFQESGRDIGRDSANIGPELQLSASRALVAALQASGLQGEMAKLFSGVAASTLTQSDFTALMAKATDLSSVINALAQTQVPGLTIDSLRALQTAGESLGQTFMRVANDFLTAKANLNSAIAARNPQFARDLTLNARNSVAQQFSDQLGLGTITSALLEQMALMPQGFTGLNTASMTLLAQFLGLQTQLEQLDTQLGTTTTGPLATFNTGLVNTNNSFAQWVASMDSARHGLADYLRGSLTSGLSPLNPMAQLAAAQANYQRNYTLAQNGDVNAISAFGSLRDEYLRLARSIYASSGAYNDIFSSTYNQGAGLTAGDVAPLTGPTFQAGIAQLADRLETVATRSETVAGAVIALGTYLASPEGKTTDPAVVTLLQNISTTLTRTNTSGVLA